MATDGTTARVRRRAPLRRERVLRAAVELADRDGIDGLSMRRLGQHLGVDPMALYRHVRGKDDLLDGAVEMVVTEIAHEPPVADWKPALRRQALAARAVMVRHPWAPRVLEERGASGTAVIGYVDAILAILRTGGVPLDLAHHALHVLGSRILGFDQALFDDSPETRLDADAAAAFAAEVAARFPDVARLAVAASHEGPLGGCDDDVEFAFGLDLILEGLDRMRTGG